MSIERIYYCDGPDCETHQRSLGRIPKSWITATQTRTHYFCSWDCVMRYAATIEPTEVVS